VVVPLQAEAVLGGHVALEDLEGLELELDHLPAGAAQEVIVVVPAEGGLVALHLAGDDGRLEDPGLGEERERPVDRGLRPADPPLLQVGDQVVDRIVTLPRERRLDDGGARLGEPQILLVEEALESLQRFLRARVQGPPSMRPGLTTFDTLATSRRGCQRSHSQRNPEIL
jgi:hypothetical protein